MHSTVIWYCMRRSASAIRVWGRRVP